MIPAAVSRTERGPCPSPEPSQGSRGEKLRQSWPLTQSPRASLPRTVLTAGLEFSFLIILPTVTFFSVISYIRPLTCTRTLLGTTGRDERDLCFVLEILV